MRRTKWKDPKAAADNTFKMRSREWKMLEHSLLFPFCTGQVPYTGHGLAHSWKGFPTSIHLMKIPHRHCQRLILIKIISQVHTYTSAYVLYINTHTCTQIVCVCMYKQKIEISFTSIIYHSLLVHKSISLSNIKIYIIGNSGSFTNRQPGSFCLFVTCYSFV